MLFATPRIEILGLILFFFFNSVSESRSEVEICGFGINSHRQFTKNSQVTHSCCGFYVGIFLDSKKILRFRISNYSRKILKLGMPAA